MKSSTRWAAALGGGTVSIVALVGVLTATLLPREPCACINPNQEVARALLLLEGMVQTYAQGHEGVKPSFDTLHAMYLEAQRSGRIYGSGKLSNAIDAESGALRFSPVKEDVYTVAYAITPDGKRHALAGIGEIERVRIVFGVPIGRGESEFPAWRPGQRVPVRSGSPGAGDR